MNLVILYLFNLFWSISIKLFIELALHRWCVSLCVNINNKLNALCNYLHLVLLCKFIRKVKKKQKTEVLVFINGKFKVRIE